MQQIQLNHVQKSMHDVHHDYNWIFKTEQCVEGQYYRKSTVSILHIHVQKYLQKEPTGLNMFVAGRQHLIGIRRDIGLGEKTAESLVATNYLTHPPVWIFLVEN